MQKSMKSFEVFYFLRFKIGWSSLKYNTKENIWNLNAIMFIKVNSVAYNDLIFFLIFQIKSRKSENVEKEHLFPKKPIYPLFCFVSNLTTNCFGLFLCQKMLTNPLSLGVKRKKEKCFQQLSANLLQFMLYKKCNQNLQNTKYKNAKLKRSKI